MRLLNERENLGLKFKILSKDKYKFIDYQDFIDSNTLKLDIEKLLKTVENKSEKQDFFKNHPDLKIEFGQLTKDDFDLKELCNGHDVINILSIALTNLLGNKKSGSKVSSEELENSLSLAYRLDDFIKTNLFESLKAWEKDNPKFRVQKV